MRESMSRDREEKLAALHRRGRYAAMVKEMFPPSVDEGKRAEICSLVSLCAFIP
jgi:hypothetical protein